MEIINSKYLTKVFKVAYMPSIPKTFERLLSNYEEPSMISFDEDSSQYSVDILYNAVNEDPDLYSSKDEVRFIKELKSNHIDYIEL